MDKKVKKEADQVERLEVVDEMELKQLEILTLREENLRLQGAQLQQMMQAAQNESNAFKAKLREKYQMGDQDSVDISTRKVVRKAG